MNVVIPNIVKNFPEIFTKNSVVLDIGTGGFLGVNTLEIYQHLLSVENIYCIELHEERAKKLIDKYKDSKITCTQDDFFLHAHPTDRKYDVIFADIDTNVFMDRWRDIVKKSKSLLSKNGYLIQMVTGHLDNVAILTSNKETVERIKEVYRKKWNTNNITDSHTRSSW